MREKYLSLLAAMAALEDPDDREDGLDLLEQFADRAEEYVYAVCREQTKPAAHLARGDYQALRQSRTDLDRERTRCHDALIASVRALNRFLASLGMDRWYTGDENSRREIGDFAGKFVADIYAGRYA